MPRTGKAETGTAKTANAGSGAGRFFEDYAPGQTIEHAVPRTVTTGELMISRTCIRNRPSRGKAPS